MKVIIKTIKGESYNLEISEEDSVLTVKEKLFEKMNVKPEDLKFIFKGKHLENDKKIKEFAIAENDTIIVMVLRKHVSVATIDSKLTDTKTAEVIASKNPETTPLPTSTQSNLTAPLANMSFNPSTNPISNTNTQPQPQVQLDPQNEIVYGSQHKEQLIRDLSDMGFPASEVENALTAAFYNKERAVDYLLNGIPTSASNGQQQTNSAPQNAPNGANPAQQGGDPNQMAQIALTPEQMSQLQQLISTTEFENIRQQALQNPEILQQLMIFLQQNRPELFALFQQNPSLLVALITGQFQVQAENDPNQEFADNDTETPEVGLTPEDQNAIQILRSFGFTEQQCIEAYLICDKNQELAINYLLDQQSSSLNQ